MMIRTFVVAAALVSVVSSASAGIQSLSGAVQEIAPPFSVQENATESNAGAGVFPEKQGVTLAAPLAVNISTSGIFDETADLTPANIPAGTKVNSYFVLADTSTNDSLGGVLVFDEPVLGIIFGTTESLAAQSDVGLSSVVYPAAGSNDATRAALELKVNEERLQLNMATRTVNFVVVRDVLFTSSIYDSFRVITAAAVPEPSTIGLAVGGMVVGLAFLRRRMGRIVQ